jgi:ABC-2 type transport system permease protein
MNQFISFVKKEFYHISRDRRTMFILLVMPIVQIIIFGFALTNEVKNSSIAILDQSKDAATKSVIAELDASNYFTVQKNLILTERWNLNSKKGKLK